jgi:hypothetical protein
MTLPYEPLDESRDEIRLLTLLPKLRDTRKEIVRCRLKTVSLAAFTSEHEAFISSSSFSALDKHKSILNWIQSRTQSAGALQDRSPTTISEPPEEYHRFN